jgi:hypothetical protein
MNISNKISVSISGSRKCSDRDIDYIKNILNYYQPIISNIHIGCCPTGVDKLVRDYCDFYKIPYQVFIADWSQGLKAGPLRNTKVIEGTLLLIAFPSPKSKGTINTIKQAENAGIKVFKYEIEG